jgi:hypothetical protein
MKVASLLFLTRNNLELCYSATDSNVCLGYALGPITTGTFYLIIPAFSVAIFITVIVNLLKSVSKYRCVVVGY